MGEQAGLSGGAEFDAQAIGETVAIARFVTTLTLRCKCRLFTRTTSIPATYMMGMMRRIWGYSITTSRRAYEFL